nr:unnamed protein product [Digitaria exilis]
MQQGFFLLIGSAGQRMGPAAASCGGQIDGNSDGGGARFCGSGGQIDGGLWATGSRRERASDGGWRARTEAGDNQAGEGGGWENWRDGRLEASGANQADVGDSHDTKAGRSAMGRPRDRATGDARAEGRTPWCRADDSPLRAF